MSTNIPNKKNTGKPGKFSTAEDEIVLDGIQKGSTPLEIQAVLQEIDSKDRIRSLSVIQKKILSLQAQNNLQENITGVIDLRTELRGKLYYADLKEQFTAKEVMHFENLWIDLVKQFRGDILPSEELQLKQFITIDILLKQLMVTRREHIQEIEEITRQIKREKRKDDIERDDMLLDNLTQQLNYLQSSITSYTPEYDKLVTKQGAIQKQLKATRDDRIKRIEDSKTNWVGLLKALDEEDYRSRVGRDMEIMKIAKDKARDELSDWHEYDDGKVDQPFLNSDTIKDE